MRFEKKRGRKEYVLVLFKAEVKIIINSLKSK